MHLPLRIPWKDEYSNKSVTSTRTTHWKKRSSLVERLQVSRSTYRKLCHELHRHRFRNYWHPVRERSEALPLPLRANKWRPVCALTEAGSWPHLHLESEKLSKRKRTVIIKQFVAIAADKLIRILRFI